MGPNQTYKFLHSDGNYKKEKKKKKKRQPTKWEKIAANNATNRRQISKIYKQLIQLNN